MGAEHKHRVCTYQEAEKAIRAHEVLHLADCFCRRPAKEGNTSWKYCGHPIEVCMALSKPTTEEHPYPTSEISREKALEIFEDWRKQGGFFRFVLDGKWICCCCACGCGCFRDKDGNRQRDPCEKSPFIEKTDMEKCNLCGDCVEICAYDVRTLTDDRITVDSSSCYGCGACAYACPEEAITMEARQPTNAGAAP